MHDLLLIFFKSKFIKIHSNKHRCCAKKSINSAKISFLASITEIFRIDNKKQKLNRVQQNKNSRK